MAENNAPESVSGTRIVDAPEGRQIPLTEFTSEEHAGTPHQEAFNFLERFLSESDFSSDDRLSQGEDESDSDYEDRLLGAVETALQPDLPDDAPEAAVIAHDALLAIDEGRPDMKDLAMAVDARKQLKQQEDWSKKHRALKNKLNREMYVAEHVVRDENGVEDVRGKLESFRDAETGEVRESILLDRIAHEVVKNALVDLPDNKIAELSSLGRVKGAKEARELLSQIARDVALDGTDLSYGSLRSKILDKLQEKNGDELVLGMQTADRRAMVKARAMLDAEFYNTMFEATRRVSIMRGKDADNLPEGVLDDVSPSVVRAIDELRKLPQSADRVAELIQAQTDAADRKGILGRFDRMDDTQRDRLIKKLSMNMFDYANKGTDWMRRINAPQTVLDESKPSDSVSDKAFEQSGDKTGSDSNDTESSSQDSDASDEDLAPAPESDEEGNDQGTDQDEADGDQGDQPEGPGERDASDEDQPEEQDDDAPDSLPPAPGRNGEDVTTEDDNDDGETDIEGLPPAPEDGERDQDEEQDQDDEEDDNDDGETDDEQEPPVGELQTSARFAVVGLKDRGMENTDRIARHIQNRPSEYTTRRDRALSGLYKVPFVGGLSYVAMHPVKTIWKGVAIKGMMDSVHLRQAARLEHAAKDITQTDASVPFELTEDVVDKAIEGAEQMKQQEGWFKRNVARRFRDLAHNTTGLVLSSEMVRSEEWLRANGQALLDEQKANSILEQTAKAEQFTFEGDDQDVIRTGLGEERVEIGGNNGGEYAQINREINERIKAIIERYASGQIADEDALLREVNAYIHGDMANLMLPGDRRLLESSEFATNILPIANEIKNRWTEYNTAGEDGETAFNRFQLDVIVGSGKWGGAVDSEKKGKLGISMREKLARRLSEHPDGIRSNSYSKGLGLARTFGTAGLYVGMGVTGQRLISAGTLARAAGFAGGVAAVAGVREGGISVSRNGRLYGLGGKTHEKIDQTSYELARGRLSSADAVLMQQMEGLMVHRVEASDLVSAITTLSTREGDLSADEVLQLKAAVAETKARIMLTDQSVTRESGAKRIFDLAAANNFIGFEEGGENRGYMALRKAVLDGQMELARTGNAGDLDDAVLIMEGQLRRGSDRSGVESWLQTQGKTGAEASQMVNNLYSDLGIQEDQSLENRARARALYAWRKGLSSAGRAAVFTAGVPELVDAAGAGIEGAGNGTAGAGEIAKNFATAPFREVGAGYEAFSDGEFSEYMGDWKNVINGKIEDPSDVLVIGDNAQGENVVESSLSPMQRGALITHELLRRAERGLEAGVDKVDDLVGDHIELDHDGMADPVKVDGLNISLPEGVTILEHPTLPGPLTGDHTVLFDGRNGQVYDMTDAGISFGTADFDGDDKLELAIREVDPDGTTLNVDPAEYTKSGEFLQGFKFDARESELGYDLDKVVDVEHPLDDGMISRIPGNTEWVEDADGDIDLVLKSDKSVILLDDVEFNDEGGIESVGDDSLLSDKDFENVDYAARSTEKIFNPDGSIADGGEWDRTMTEIEHRRYFSENNSQLGVHTYKEGDALVIRMNEVANRSAHVADVVNSNAEHGFYFTVGNNGSEGIYVPADHGEIRLDPTDNTPITMPNGEDITRAQLYKMLVNDSEFKAIGEQGDIATELTGRREVFALSGGSVEATLLAEAPDGTWAREVVGTIKGEGSLNLTAQTIENSEIPVVNGEGTNQIFEVRPPLFPGGEESNLEVPEMLVVPIPSYLEKERSVKDENGGEIGNLPEDVSFTGGTFTGNQQNQGDQTDEGDVENETGGDVETEEDEPGEEGQEDEEGVEVEIEEENVETNTDIERLRERINALENSFKESISQQIVNGQLTAEMLVENDVFGVDSLEDAQSIIDDEAQRELYIASLWSNVSQVHESEYLAEVQANGRLNQIQNEVIRRLRQLDTLTPVERALIEADPVPTYEEGLRQIRSSDVMRNALDTKLQEGANAVSDAGERAQIIDLYKSIMEKVDGLISEDPENAGEFSDLVRQVTRDLDANEIPEFIRTQLVSLGALSDGRLRPDDRTITGFLNRIKFNELSDTEGDVDNEVATFYQRIARERDTQIYTSDDYMDSLEARFREIEAMAGVEEEVVEEETGTQAEDETEVDNEVEVEDEVTVEDEATVDEGVDTVIETEDEPPVEPVEADTDRLAASKAELQTKVDGLLEQRRNGDIDVDTFASRIRAIKDISPERIAEIQSNQEARRAFVDEVWSDVSAAQMEEVRQSDRYETYRQEAIDEIKSGALSDEQRRLFEGDTLDRFTRAEREVHESDDLNPEKALTRLIALNIPNEQHQKEAYQFYRNFMNRLMRGGDTDARRKQVVQDIPLIEFPQFIRDQIPQMAIKDGHIRGFAVGQLLKRLRVADLIDLDKKVLRNAQAYHKRIVGIDDNAEWSRLRKAYKDLSGQIDNTAQEKVADSDEFADGVAQKVTDLGV